MTQNKSQIDQLVIKHLLGELTDKDQDQLNAWLAVNPSNQKLFEQLTSYDFVNAEVNKFYSFDTERGWENAKRMFHMKREAPVKKFNGRWWAVAASFFLMLGLGSYFLFFNKTGKKNEIVVAPAQNDVEAPNETKAMIILPDGRTVALDSITSGILATHGNIEVVKNTNGEIVYNGTNNIVQYSTLLNPKGSPVQTLKLVDGSKVWMNAESSLRFFTSVGNEPRRIEVTGECYFEAAHDPSKPFIVKDVTKGTEVQVLGTSFNVNTYSDEPMMKVTLLEGSVKVRSLAGARGDKEVVLRPGQQAQVSDVIKVVNDTNIDEVMAWKNGSFHFEGADIQTIMRQVSRWYDVEVIYKGKIPTGHYRGKPSRNLSAAQMLKIVENSGVKVNIEGNRIVISEE